jgi:BirA family biotin operon repressor/biotin-[acetyl-CoA-carboxylase] ligase
MYPHIGKTIVSIKCTESTNNYASRQVRENEVEAGTVFLAYEQTAGRGQHTNQWEAEAGKNLTFSIFLQPTFLDIRRQFMLSKAICMGLHTFLSHYVEGVKIKWPNDIYVGERKICGILIENAVMNGTITQTIIGIGLNINQTKFLSEAPNPVSLKMVTGNDYQLDEMLTGLLNEIGHFFKKLEAGQFDGLDNAFHQNLYRLNEWRQFKDETHKYTGQIIGVNQIGQLKIQEQNGPVWEYHFKEVAYL